MNTIAILTFLLLGHAYYSDCKSKKKNGKVPQSLHLFILVGRCKDDCTNYDNWTGWLWLILYQFSTQELIKNDKL